MFSHVFISMLVLETALCQINGEFWWLNKNVAQLQHGSPPQPTFEDISELETDESVQVIFKDNELNFREKRTGMDKKDIILVNNKILPFIVFLDNHTKSVEPQNVEIDIAENDGNNVTRFKENSKNSSSLFLTKEVPISSFTNANKSNKDEFAFVFPSDNDKQLFENQLDTNYTNSSKTIKNENSKMSNPSKVIVNEEIWFEEDKMLTESESICTFIIPHECIARNGFIHKTERTCPKNIRFDTRKICCVLPLASRNSGNSKLVYKRYKRSDPGEPFNAALKQRNALLSRKYNSYAQRAKLGTTTSPTKPIQKIVTPGDYIDPYWNIKNAKFRNSNQQSKIGQDYQNTQYDGSQEYDENYGVELPKPGLVGLYSDREDRVTSWKLKTNKGFSYGVIDEGSDEDSTENDFGYSTIDPRLGNRKSTTASRLSRPFRRNPSNSDDTKANLDSKTIHFHSTPEFHVLEGFKLLNLAENKNRHTRKTITKSPSEEESEIESTSPVVTSSDFDYDYDVIDITKQVFKNCGKKKMKPTSDTGLGTSGTENLAWLAVVVFTKDPRDILCYATIVHPRAAVTAASCVQGEATGELSTITGLWDLQERTKSQHRVSSTHIHPHFNVNDLANDLAIVHWKRPLRLQANVMPACLADPHVSDKCYFIGWGGYDQEFQQLPKWQQATILTPRTCGEKVSAPDVDLPAGAFCASVDTRGTVTGVGGPLLCRGGDRVSIVGVAVYREDVIVLLPTLEWVASALRELKI